MLVDLAEKQISVGLRFEREEGLAEAGRESRSGLLHTLLGPCNFGSVSGVEVIDGLFGSEFGDGREDGEGITGEEDDVLGVASHSGNFGVGNELQRV